MKHNAQKKSPSYLVLGCRPWNRQLYEQELERLPGRWHYVSVPADLTVDFVDQIHPRYIFFLHWSWKVPGELVERYECVCFHMTDVPFGRGGSPLQNLIVGGHRQTKLTALRMTREFDAGPVYGKEPLSLEGGAEEIYMRAGRLSANMIQRIIRLEPKPVPQRGEVVTFKRRKPEESELGSQESLGQLHDFIRMLDAEGYPRAFLEHAGFRFEFSRSALYEGRVVADVKITRAEKKASRK
ncbi:MAG TPA: methionyl-tRNA formyltransferase [Verrucomicrobiae bacterium]|nr:methionyl-tRNA formyltransferase [Verrucomicrobiae bacterium]